MRFVDSFAPHMGDLMSEEGRQALAIFGRQFLEAIQDQVDERPPFPKILLPASVSTSKPNAFSPSRPLSFPSIILLLFHNLPLRKTDSCADLRLAARMAASSHVVSSHVNDSTKEVSCQSHFRVAFMPFLRCSRPQGILKTVDLPVFLADHA